MKRRGIDSTFRNKLLLRIHKTTVLENLCIAQEKHNRPQQTRIGTKRKLNFPNKVETSSFTIGIFVAKLLAQSLDGSSFKKWKWKAFLVFFNWSWLFDETVPFYAILVSNILKQELTLLFINIDDRV